MSVTRIVLVDDQPLFRAGLRMLLESQSDLGCVGEAGDGVAAIALVRDLRPDLVLMDVRMPVLDGIQATAQIMSAAATEGWNPPRILVLTTFDLDENAARAIQAGAAGFVLKDAAPDFLLAAVRTVRDGNAVLATSATRTLLRRLSTAQPAPPPAAWDDLTPRERDVFHLAARGLSNAEIAAREFLAEATVKTHVSRILSKLGLRDRVQLVVFAYEHRIPSDDSTTM